MRIAVLVARLLLGGVFLFFGLNALFGFVDLGEPSAEVAEVMAGFDATGYLLPLIHWTEVVAGGLLLAGLFVPLALVVLAPLIVNILAFHVWVEPEGLAIAAVLVAVEVLLAFAYRKHFGGLLNPFAQPAVKKRVDT